ncbi:MAG: TFIIB-type zinc ribbon-containing protein [Desulfobacteraceae bacterium]|nr:TFIIB-type zinc ribbon-containing protein [Desulfobacteraceae bacterium]
MNNRNSTSESTDRFTDQKHTIIDFMDEILIVCPECSSCAIVKPIPGKDNSLFSDRRLTCTGCGLTKDKKVKNVLLSNNDAPVESYFKLPLWLMAGQGAKTLWAYNKRHLEYIESFVQAIHRMRGHDLPGCSNCSIISRLPKWIKKGSNRKQVLSLIQKLLKSLAEEQMC